MNTKTTSVYYADPVRYFRHRSGSLFVAMVESHFTERVQFFEYKGQVFTASVEQYFERRLAASYYEAVENGYTEIAAQDFKEVREKAIFCLLQFPGDSPEFTTPNTRPFMVPRPNGEDLPNDLPF